MSKDNLLTKSPNGKKWIISQKGEEEFISVVCGRSCGYFRLFAVVLAVIFGYFRLFAVVLSRYLAFFGYLRSFLRSFAVIFDYFRSLLGHNSCNWHVTEQLEIALKQSKSPLKWCLTHVTSM